VSTSRGRRRREAVLDAAAALFLEHGFHGTSVDDLGAAAGISGPGLYRHFASKDALLMAVLDRIWGQLKPALEQAAGLPPEEALEVLLDAHLELALGQPDAVVLLLRELRHLPDDYRDRSVRNHRRYVDAWAHMVRGLHPGLDLDEARGVALAVHGLIDSATLRPLVLADGLSRDAQRALLDRLARGVLRDAGAMSPGASQRVHVDGHSGR
jgi:AcrR family transcriptional regulator